MFEDTFLKASGPGGPLASPLAPPAGNIPKILWPLKQMVKRTFLKASGSGPPWARPSGNIPIFSGPFDFTQRKSSRAPV